MQRDLLIREMIDAAEQAQLLVAGPRPRSTSTGCRDALLWNFTVLGEAATLVSQETRQRFAEIPWRNPARLRNRVVHGYWSVDVGILHTTATEQLGGFVRVLREAAAALEQDG